MKKYLVVFAILFLGCAVSMQQIKKIQINSFNVPYNKVFTAVMKTLPDYELTVSNTDKESGLINTNWQPIKEGQEGADLFSLGSPRQITIYLTKIDDSNTDIRIIIQRKNDSQAVYCDSRDNKLYEKLFNSIKENLK